MLLIDDYDTMKTQRGLACNYECVRDGLFTENVREYNGPVRIVVAQNPQLKYDMTWKAAAGLAFVNYLIGAVALIILVHEAATFGYDKSVRLHVAFCTTGMTFLSNFGMMNIFHIYGASHSLKREDMRREHLYFHLTGMLLSVCGFMFQIGNMDKEEGEKHVSSCLLALVTGLGSIATGLLSTLMKNKLEKFTIIHLACGAASCFFNTICYITALEYSHFSVFCKKFVTYGCMVLSVLHLIIFTFILFASLTFILHLLKKRQKTIKICITEEEAAKQNKKKEEKRLEEEEKKKAQKIKEEREAYVEKKLLEAEELKKVKPEEEGKKKKDKSKKTKKPKPKKPKASDKVFSQEKYI